MKVRTKKLLSILLAASMVFSMNITAMGAQPEASVESTSVILTTGGRTDPEPFSDADWNEPKAEPRSTETTSETQLYSGSDLIVRDKDGKAVTKVVVDGEKVTITGLNLTDPVSLNKTSIGKQVIETILCAGEQKKDVYLVNKKDVNVSQNMAGYIDGTRNENDKVDNWESSIPSYYDVIKLDTGNYLFVAYGNSLAWVEGEPDQIPVWDYTGQKYVPYKSGKDSKSKREELVVDVALVKADGSTVEKIPGATASAKVKGNTKDASVSGEVIPVKDTKVYNGTEYKDAIFDEYVKGGAPADLPTFTLKVKATGDAKADAKAIKTALKEKTYKFAIRQSVVYVGVPYGAVDAAIVTKNSLSFNTADESLFSYIRNVDAYKLTFSGYAYKEWWDLDPAKRWYIDSAWNSFDSGIILSKYNGKKATVTRPLLVNGKEYAVKVDAKKDYVLKTDGALGASATPVGYIDEFKNNYVYSKKVGYYKYGYKLAFRQSPTNKKLLRGGIYMDGDNGFVYSED